MPAIHSLKSLRGNPVMPQLAALCRLSRCLHDLFSLRGTVYGTDTGGGFSPDSKEEHAATLERVTALRDVFIDRIHAAGLTCPIAPPTIVIDHTPPFGNYQDESNVLHTSDWYMLNDEERGCSFAWQGRARTRQRRMPILKWSASLGVYHELGHWWQACRKAIVGRPHYEVEFGANRIALPYWRETSPVFAERTTAMFDGLLTPLPDPVPPGQQVENYFNENYEKLGLCWWIMPRKIVRAQGIDV
jgi:hypothetical protein